MARDPETECCIEDMGLVLFLLSSLGIEALKNILASFSAITLCYEMAQRPIIKV